MGGVFHVVFEGHNYTDTFQSEDDGAEEHGPVNGLDHDLPTVDGVVGDFVEDVIEGDAHSDGHQDVGDHGEGGEVLELFDGVEE